jgi:hypothetical protein
MLCSDRDEESRKYLSESCYCFIVIVLVNLLVFIWDRHRMWNRNQGSLESNYEYFVNLGSKYLPTITSSFHSLNHVSSAGLPCFHYYFSFVIIKIQDLDLWLHKILKESFLSISLKSNIYLLDNFILLLLSN